MKTLLRLFFATLVISSATLYAQDRYAFNDKADGFSLSSRSNNTLTILHNVSGITIETTNRDGVEGQFITLSGIHIANDAGAPDLPSGSTFVAIPNGAKASVKMVNAKTKTLKDIDLIPAPQPQLENDNSPAIYRKDMNIYGRDAFYPATPYQISEVMTVRGMEMVQVGVMPFQYNPVTKELVVYENLELEITLEGGDGTYGDLRYRSPEWDQILSDLLLNRDVLQEVDYGERLRKHYENRETGCEYIIITPDNEEFVQLADSIKRFRTLQGIPTEIYTVSQCGGNNSQAIRNFIRDAYNDWDMPPTAVLILGDHNTDPTKGVVSVTMNNHPGGSDYNPYISDHSYSVMGNNHMPEIILGRITGRNYDELYHMIKKDLDYERTPPTDPDFYDHPITAMGFQLERWFQLCSEVVNGFWEHALGKHPVRLNAIYQGNPGSQWSSAQRTNTIVNYFGPDGCGYIPRTMSHLTDWSATGAKVNQAINSGAFIIQHRDHGNEEVWGEPSYTIGNIKNLNNEHLVYVMSNNCLTGRFNYNGPDGCFAEVFHRHQHGALGLIAATEVSYSFVNDVYVWGAYDNMWPEFMPSYGTEHPTNFLLPAFGNAAGKYFLRQSSWTDNEVKEITYYLFHQHGDTFMNLYSEVPRNVEVEMLPVLTAGSGSYEIKTEEGATIALTANGQIIGFGYGTGDVQQITVSPQLPGTMVKLTITKQNCYRYEHNISVIPSEGPYLIFDGFTVNDANGNGNQSIDYNEDCQLNVTLRNVGSSAIDNITATLTCQDPAIQILQNTSQYNHINALETSLNENAFAVHFSDAIEDGKSIRFFLSMEGNDYQFNDSIDIVVNAPKFAFTSLTLSDEAGNPIDRLSKGASAWMSFELANTGHSQSAEAASNLQIMAPFLDIEANPFFVPEMEAGTTYNNTFKVTVLDNAPEGGILHYAIKAESGYYQTIMESEIPLGYTMEDFEDEQLNPNLTWNTGNGNKAWTIIEDENAPGGHCLKSPVLEDNKTSYVYIGVNTNVDDKISFYHRTSTENGDKLVFMINSETVQTWGGQTDWTRSEFDLKAGQNTLRFGFKKNAQNSGGDDCVMSDQICLPPMAELILYAGDDEDVCASTSYIPNSYVYHQQSIQWSSDGDGSFDDNTLIHPTYTFGENDLTAGEVVLHLTAVSELNGIQAVDKVTLTLKEDLTNMTPGAPVGDTVIDLSQTQQSVYQTINPKPYNVNWAIEPEQAGTLHEDGNQTTITWNSDFRGIATLSYVLDNGCGTSEPSTVTSIRVFNSTGLTEYEGPNLQVYPNPAKDLLFVKARFNQSGTTVLRVFDDQGRLVMESMSNNDHEVLDDSIRLTGLRSGIYFIQVLQGEEGRFARFIVM